MTPAFEQHLRLADQALANNRPGQAQTHLRNAIALCPHLAGPRARLAAIMLQRGQFAAAAGMAREALARDAGCRDALEVLARCHLQRGERPRGQAAPPVRRPWPADPRLDRLGPVDHLFVLRALILRDLRLKYRDNSFGFIMELIRPIAVMVAHYVLFYYVHRRMPAEVPIEVYVIGGFSVWFAFNFTAQGAIHGGKWPGGATLTPGVTALHLRLARAGWALLLNLVFCLTAVLPLKLYGDALPLPNLLLTSLILGIAGMMGFGFGLLSERLSHLWPVVKPFEKLLIWALFVTCGLYFSIATMLPLLAALFWYNPLLHLVEYERHAFHAGYPVALVSLSYPALWALGLLFAGLAACRALGPAAHE